jgi:serralysin
LTVIASDGVNNTNQEITVNVTDVVENSAPVFTSNAAFTAAENQISIGSVVTSDAESDSITYSLSGTDASSLAISSSGVLTFSSSPDYETKTSYSASVTANDGTDSTSQAITITITNINDNNPAISSDASFNAAENQTGIGSVSASDADGDSLTYSLSGIDASSLSISSSGVLTFGSSVDYETKTSYSATVSVSDGTNAVSQNITISITNLNDNNPVISSSANFSAAENQTSIGSISASDADGGTLTYSLSGTDASSLSISSSGVLSFNSAPDYEAKTSYSASVGVTDGTNAISQNVTISISNLNDNKIGRAHV